MAHGIVVRPAAFAAVVFCAALTAHAAIAPCPASKPLGAHIELRIEHTDQFYARSSRVRAWFELEPPLYDGAFNKKLLAPWTAKEIIWRTTASTCRDTAAYGDCRCPASRASGTVDLSSGYATYQPVGPRLSVLFPEEIRTSADVQVECFDGVNKNLQGASLHLTSVFNVLPRGDTARGVYVDASGCYDAQGRLKPECVKQPERFALLPFAGSGEIRDSGNGSEALSKARWEVCCGCGIAPRGGMEGETDECGDSAQQRGLFEVAIDTAKALRGNLRPRIDRFENEKRLAEQYRSDFETVSRSCAGWDISIELLKALLGGANAPESAQTLVQIFEILEKVADEDPSILLNVVEGLPLPASLEFTFLGVDGFTIGALWDSAAEVYEGALEVDQADSIPQMRQRLEDCSDVPLVSNLVYDDAKLHLRHLEAAVRELPAIRELATRIEQADTEVYNRWVAYHRACLEEAECRGTDPAQCGAAPP